MPKKPTITQIETVAQSRLFKIEQVHLNFTNGEERVFERIRGNRTQSRGAVMIAPITANNEVMLIKEYACGTERYECGLPKGLIEPDETPDYAANREMQEEVGVGAKKIVYLTSMSAAPQYFVANMAIYLAYDLYPSKLEGDEPEPIEVITEPLVDIPALIEKHEITEARTVATLFLVKEWLTKNA